jgi:hypothetical protein
MSKTIFRRAIAVCTIFTLSFSLFSAEINLSDLQVTEKQEVSMTMSGTHKSSSTWLSTRNLAWGTMALLGATALTGREQKVNPLHLSLASLSAMSYGFFMQKYCSESHGVKDSPYKWASYSKWLHIPAMLILPIAGAMAQRQFAKGGHSATGFASLHKPSALASVVGMALTTLSLTFEF